MKTKSFLRSLRDQGFTLVELMVVVGIIGILSAVAIPNFQKYQAKSKSTEAKLHLAAIYTAEQSFYSDYDTYAVCLTDMGYDPGPEAATRYYLTGFNADHTTGTRTYAVSNGAACAAYASGDGWYPAGKAVGAAITAATAVTFITNTALTETSFIAGAGGIIEKNNTTAAAADRWTIDQMKRVVHRNTGY